MLFNVIKPTRGVLEFISPSSALDQLWQRLWVIPKKVSWGVQSPNPERYTQSWAVIAVSEPSWIFAGTSTLFWGHHALYGQPIEPEVGGLITLTHSSPGHPLSLFWLPPTSLVLPLGGFPTCLMQLVYLSDFWETTLSEQSCGTSWVSDRYFLALSQLGWLLYTDYFYSLPPACFSRLLLLSLLTCCAAVYLYNSAQLTLLAWP